MLLEINPDNIDDRKIDSVVNALENNGVIIIPTDTVYAMACSLNSKKAINEMAKIKGIKTKKTNFSMICTDISSLSEFIKQIPRPVFRVMKKALPGAFTFILPASNQVQKLFDQSKKEVGIRIPDSPISLSIVERLGFPLIVTSIHDEDEILEYTTDPYEIYERFGNKVELVVDGGYGKNEASTIVNCMSGDIEIIREGVGDINLLQ